MLLSAFGIRRTIGPLVPFQELSLFPGLVLPLPIYIAFSVTVCTLPSLAYLTIACFLPPAKLNTFRSRLWHRKGDIHGPSCKALPVLVMEILMSTKHCATAANYCDSACLFQSVSTTSAAENVTSVHNAYCNEQWIIKVWLTNLRSSCCCSLPHGSQQRSGQQRNKQRNNQRNHQRRRRRRRRWWWWWRQLRRRRRRRWR